MIVAVDFDGTIVEDAYPKIGRPKIFAFETLRRLQSDGHQVILWTCRQGKELEEAVEFCRERGFEFYAINSNFPEESPEHTYPRKLVADLWIDDRNLGGLPDWGVIYKMVISENPYQPLQEDPELIMEPRRRSLLDRFLR